MTGDETDRPSPDPAGIRSIAVTTDDVVAAFEAAVRGRRDAVLRVTPPFEGRKRARLHVAGTGGEAGETALHLDPRRLIADDAPPYPEVDATEDELRAAGEYSREAHRERHAEAVEEWRAAVRDHVVETVVVGDAADEDDARARRAAIRTLG